MVLLTPSVTVVVNFDGRNDIVDEELSNFYRGFAHVCLKDSVFQLSNVERHVFELMPLLDAISTPCPVIFVKTDHGWWTKP